MKVAVSLPAELFERADESAAELGLNRSQLYARAIEEFLRARTGDAVTQRLDALADELASDGSGPDESRAAGRQLIDRGQWEW